MKMLLTISENEFVINDVEADVNDFFMNVIDSSENRNDWHKSYGRKFYDKEIGGLYNINEDEFEFIQSTLLYTPNLIIKGFI